MSEPRLKTDVPVPSALDTPQFRASVNEYTNCIELLDPYGAVLVTMEEAASLRDWLTAILPTGDGR